MDTPKENGVRVSIYMPKALAKRIDDLAYQNRMTRSRYVTNVLSEITKPAIPGVRKNETVSDV